MNKNGRPLLSICIPTYNRSQVLYQNLTRLLSLPSFDDNVELVISDNASTDDTKETVRELIDEYPTKSISYHRNEENIKDRNFLKALSLGNGTYLKLLNDYTAFAEDDLRLMKEKITAHQEDENINLFFFDKIKGIKSGTKEIWIDNPNDFVRMLSNKMTWISNFGCFRNQLDELYQFQDRSQLMLLQMLWFLHLVSTSTKTLLINVTSYHGMKINATLRTPYNFFTPHVVSYYTILDEYVQKGMISEETIRKDKTKVLKDFVGARIKDYLFTKKENNFDFSNSWTILWKYFHKTPYFYVILLKGSFHMCQRIIKDIITFK